MGKKVGDRLWEALGAQTYLDSGAVVELEESWWVVIDINNLDIDVCICMQWGLPAVRGSQRQGIAGCLLQDAQWKVSNKGPHICSLTHC